jgi:hypothetical protein
MKKRVTPTTTIIACLLIAVLAIGAAACGSGSTTTTAAPTTTTAAGSVTVPSLQMTPEVQTYLQQMQQWAAALNAISSTDDPLKITDASKVTDAQITAAEAVASKAHAALDQLKAITPPAALAAVHQSLVTLISSAADLTDKAIDALKKKDQAALTAVEAQANQLENQMNSLFESLAPLLMRGATTS